MNIPTKTLKKGFSLPVYGLGTWMMGGGREPEYDNDDSYIAAVRDAIDSGVTHIDTAELYGGGHAEELIAIAMDGIDRSRLTIASKVLAGLDGGYDGVLRACAATLERLETDYLDLYLLHRFPSTGIDDVMRAINRLIDEGLVRNFGVSNMTIPRIEKIQSLTSSKIVCNQLEYSLQVREAEARGIIRYCQDNDMLVTAWGPLMKGEIRIPKILEEIATAYGKTPRQVALNWLLAQPNIVVIPKTTQKIHLEENLGALGWELSAADVNRLSVEYPDQQTHSDRVPLDYIAEVPA